MIERITENTDDVFQYQIFGFTNSTGRGVDQIAGEQKFVPTNNGTRLELSYKVLPGNFISRQVVRSPMEEIER